MIGGQHPRPSHVIAHLSDPHFLAGDRLLYGAVDTQRNLTEVMAQLERSGARPQAIVFTGDLADLGEPEAYRALRDVVEPAARRMGADLVWVMGNHDERAEFQTELLGGAPTSEPQDRVYDVDGLRIVVLDTSVPGFHHGDLDDSQLVWLAGVLAEPAPHGTLLAMHHPPIATPLELMEVLELKRQDRLAEVVRGTDVRGILAGHLHYSSHGTFAGIPVSVSAATCYLHYSSHGTFAGIPVSVSAATCYLIDVGSPPHTQIGRAGGEAFTLVHVYDDGIVHSVVPVGDLPAISRFSEEFLTRLAAMTEDERLDAFSRKRPAARDDGD